jgi:hypothetical protein
MAEPTTDYNVTHYASNGDGLGQPNNHTRSRVLCPITRHPCGGDLSHLCEEYGCARKGGLSPWSDENL